MCANYKTANSVRKLLLSGERLEAGTEVYPGGTGWIVANVEPGEMRSATFGLLPHWAKPQLARSTYNARSETIAEKPSFRSAWRQRQLCVIPAQCIYEPSYECGKPVRWRIERVDGRSFGIAGLWERVMKDSATSLWSFTMITISAAEHPLMKRFHDPADEKRSVVILDDDDWDAWLMARTVDEAQSMLKPFDPDIMQTNPDPRISRAQQTSRC